MVQMRGNCVEKRVYSHLKLVKAGGLSNICDGKPQRVELEEESMNSCNRDINNKSRKKCHHKNKVT